MANALKTQTYSGGIDLLDGMWITLSKVSSEELLARVPFVGNGTYRSGLMKLGGAIAMSMMSKQKTVQIISTGLLIDGSEDIISNVKRATLKNSATNAQVL